MKFRFYSSYILNINNKYLGDFQFKSISDFKTTKSETFGIKKFLSFNGIPV